MSQSLPNRPVRTRMPGGVGGGRREASPYPDPAFQRRDKGMGCFRRVATIESSRQFRASLRDSITSSIFPGVSTPG